MSVALQLQHGLSEQAALVSTDLLTVAAATVAALFTGLAGASGRGRTRVGWLLISSGFALWAGGEAGWTWYDAFSSEAPFPSWLDVAYLAGYPPLMLGAVLLASPSRAWAQARTALDAGALILAGSAVLWRLVLGPTYADGEATILARAVGGAYPMGDLVVVFATFLLVSRSLRRTSAMFVVGPLATGMLLISFGDIGFAYVTLHEWDGAIQFLNLQWTLGYVFVALAGWRQHVRPTTDEAADADTPSSALRNAAPLGILVFQLGFATAQRTALLDDPVYLLLGWLSILSIVIRQFVVLKDNANLNRALADTGEVLEATVAERTEELRRLVSILEATPDFVGSADVDGRTLYLNRAGRRMVGISEHANIGEYSIADYHPSWAAALIQEQGLPGAERDGTWSGETAVLSLNGKEIPASQVIIAHRNGDGNIAYFSTIARDISDRKEFESRLVDLANHDSLTRLFNRRRFEEELEQELARSRRFRHGAALFFIDLDGFKFINDDLGHRAGDDLLIEVARVLRDSIRETDTLARLGGDEFAVLLPQTTREEAEFVARRIVTGVREIRLPVRDAMVRVTTSIGIALTPEHGSQAEDLLARADLAMYEAKEARDRYKIFNAEQSTMQELTSRREWEERIRCALENDRFLLYLQPIRHLQNSSVQYEVLLRLVEDGAIVSPATFMPIAERSTLIHEIDRWVVGRSIRLLSECQVRGIDLKLEVNLSGKAFQDEGLLTYIEEQLKSSGIDASRLVLEITETAAISSIGRAQSFISSLRSLGCGFALDDFGVGYSSFYYLKTLPVDYLKIDGSFIRNLPRDNADQHLVRSMVELARGLGKRTIAEFVGDDETVTLLRDLGVDFGQGYFLGEPQPATEVIARATRRAA